MITIADLQAFVNDSSYPDSILQNCIDIATHRVMNLLNLSDTSNIPNTPEVQKALLLLAASELATNVNMYWSKAEGRQTMNVKNMVTEAERLLNVVPTSCVIWQPLNNSSSF